MQDLVNSCNVNSAYLGLISNGIYITVGNECLMGFGIYVSGWMQNLQEKADEWDDWDELVDRGLLLTRMEFTDFSMFVEFLYFTSLAWSMLVCRFRKASACFVLGPGHQYFIRGLLIFWIFLLPLFSKICMSLADFSVVQDLTDEITSTEKPSAAASWGKEEDRSLENETPAVNVAKEVPALNGDSHVEKEAPSTPEPALDVTPENLSEAPRRTGASDVSSSKPSSDVKSGVSSSVPTTKASERCINLRPCI